MRTKALTKSQYNQLKQCLCWRDSIILQVSAETGLRISDVLNFTPLNIKKQQLILEKKTKKNRYIELPTKLITQLKRYVNTYKITDKNKIFNVTRQAVYINIKNMTNSLGWKNISSHSTRKYYAQEFYKKYGLKATQDELMHDNVNTTILYLSEVT